MSKLYDVISRLEDVAEQDAKGVETPLPKFEKNPRKRQSPSLRIVLFSLLFVVLGILAVGLTAWWQNWFSKQDVALFSSNPPLQQEQQTLIHTGDSQPQPTLPNDTNAITQPSDEIIPNQLFESTPINQPLAITDELLPDTMIVSAGQLDRTVETIDDFLKTRIYDQLYPTSTVPLKNVRIYIHALDIAEAVVEEELPSVEETFPTSQSTNINENKAKTSRWLHQAEVYRHNGEWEGAITLYKRVWENSGEPDVANNLAAALIQIKRLEEALEVLQEASIIAPEDPDIKQNIKTVKQLLPTISEK